jgi:hypothetical protein
MLEKLDMQAFVLHRPNQMARFFIIQIGIAKISFFSH